MAPICCSVLNVCGQPVPNMTVRLTTYSDPLTYRFENTTSIEGYISFWFPSNVENPVGEVIDAVRYARFSLTFFPRLGMPTRWPHITSEFCIEHHISGCIQLRLASNSYSIEVVPTQLEQPLRLDGRYNYPGGPSQAFFVPPSLQIKRVSPLHIGRPPVHARPRIGSPENEYGASIQGAGPGSGAVHQGSLLPDHVKKEAK